jgi:hypothetical protein
LPKAAYGIGKASFEPPQVPAGFLDQQSKDNEQLKHRAY